MADSPPPDWYLKEWMAHFQKRQVSMVNELGWNKSRANHVFHGEQPYRREVVNEIAAWLGIAPFELLMHPKDAMALRQFREAANQISKLTGANEPASYANAAEEGQPFDHERPRSPPPKRTGTRG